MDKLRLNSIGIQMIPELLHKKLYGARLPHHNPKINPNYILSQLKKSIENVQFKTTNDQFSSAASSTSIDHPWQRVAKYLPPLKNNNVTDHLEQLGRKYSTPYLKCVQNLLTIPDSLLENRPKEWSFQRGWTRYTADGKGGYLSEAVKFPLEDSVVFDIEVCMEASNNNRPTLAVALTPEAWYSWCGDTLINLNTEATETRPLFGSIDDISMEDLIPMGRWQSGQRLIVGHNVSFDRSYIKEQYNIDLDETRFLDTMSLHIAVSGLNQDQKMFAIRNGNPWNSISSLNNLNDVYKLYCQTEENVDKDPRNVFVKGSLADVYRSFQPLTDYCANDVAVTLKILKSLFPTFIERFPHPVTLVGMMEMSVMYLPVNKRTWKRYLNESTSIYEEYKGEINQTLKEIACDSCSYLTKDNYSKDPWLWDLDWSTRPVGFKKSFELRTSKKSEKAKSTINKSLIETLMDTGKHLKKNQPLLPGYPKWFLEFCESSRNLNKLDTVDFETIIESNQLNISPKLRAIPKLLKLMWNGFPLYYDKSYGWGYLVPDEAQLLEDVSQAAFGPMAAMLEMAKTNQAQVDRLKREEGVKGVVPGCLFFKLPHKNGPNNKVGNPLGKDFISKVADGTLRPLLSTVKDLVLQQNKISYWVNSSKRILSQMVIAYDSSTGDGSILPRVVVSGTVTRRAVEPTWLTASNSYADRLGSELKGIIQCPPGYRYVGADVDSQELWIAALIGDAHYSGIQGSTGLGWMTLRGDKSAGTDMHSVTANSIHISRDEAKVLNYARIYGSGPDFAARFLRQSDPSLGEEAAKAKAKKIFVETKGVRRKYTRFEGDGQADTVVRQWANGTESHMFNKLEAIATSDRPETPFLKGRISRALEPSVVGYDFMTSRINWVVQSSAVDFLHLLLVSMKWLLAEFNIDGRFSISIHDEIRYIVREEDKYRAALALQLSNLMARAYFTSALNLNDLPASVAFFSSIEIDACLRKDVTQDCKTPSNPLGLSKGYGVPAGESLSINRLVEVLQKEVHPSCDEDRPSPPTKERLTVISN